MTIFITSDTHFSHNNIIKYCNRPFINSFEMNQKLINNWNSVVQKGDLVYHLGDFVFNDIADDFLFKLNGNKILIAGNHDKDKTKKAIGWKEVHKSSILETTIEGQFVVLCHYPMRSWNRSFHGSWHLFGHCHGKMAPYNFSFDVGVDCWDYTPVSWQQIKDKIATLKSSNLI